MANSSNNSRLPAFGAVTKMAIPTSPSDVQLGCRSTFQWYWTPSILTVPVFTAFFHSVSRLLRYEAEPASSTLDANFGSVTTLKWRRRELNPVATEVIWMQKSTNESSLRLV